MALNLPVNLFPSNSEQQGENESPGFIRKGSKERFYKVWDIFIRAERIYFWPDFY